MTTKRFPTLDVSDTLFDKFVPSTIARTADIVPIAAKGAPNGVSPLNSSGFLDLAFVPPGFVCNLHYNGSAWPGSRPTARTDVTFWLDAPSGTAKPGWLLTNDHYEVF